MHDPGLGQECQKILVPLAADVPHPVDNYNFAFSICHGGFDSALAHLAYHFSAKKIGCLWMVCPLLCIMLCLF